MRVRLDISYDGTEYCGWQIQNNGITIQGEIDRALSEVFGEKVHCIGASRTDAGVHARMNVAAFDTKSRMPAEKIAFALNAHLPRDITVIGSFEAASDFNPRYDAKRKTYSYKILSRTFPDPLIRRYSLFHHYPLDETLMEEGASFLVGEHDFTTFSSIHAQSKSYIRHIYGLSVNREGDLITLTICGNGFLYNMVRIIAGTLIEVGEKRREPKEMGEILAKCDRSLAGPTAPPQGLCLENIEFE